MKTIVEEATRRRTNEYIEEQFQEIKAFVYRKLWDDIEEGRESIFELPYDKKIVILNGKISFDNRKTFLHRSEEKLISKAFDELQKVSADCLFEEIYRELQEKSSRVEKSRVDKGSNENNSITNLLDKFIETFEQLSESEKEDIGKYATFMLELEVINEQIDLIKEIGGSKEKLLSLLEEKHELLKRFKDM